MSGSTDGSAETFERGQKEHFVQLLRDQIRGREVQFVGEETRYGEESIAQRVCGLENRRYANIDMTPQERERLGIPPGYDEDKNLSDAEKARCHLEREKHMLSTILAESDDANSILVICGRLHAQRLACGLRERGHHVAIVDLLEQSWYMEDWQNHIMHNL